jgi:PAS domain S-box-containing protein
LLLRRLTGEREYAIATWTGNPEDLQQIVEANERMSFLLALSTELARIRSPQEVVCTALARLRERLGAARVTLAEIDEAQGEAIVLSESGGDAAPIEVTSLPLPAFMATEMENQEGHSISVPLIQNGKRVAQLSVVSTMPREWTSCEAEVVRRVADIVWPALEKARTDRRVTMSEERLKLAQGVAQIGTWDWDPETRVAYFSAESRELLGLTGEGGELQEEWKRGIHPKDLDAVSSMLEECATCRACEIEYRYQHPSRGERWIYSKAGLVDHAGHRHVVGICLDVTTRREAEEALKGVNQRKDEFLAMLAHELRNPLAPIRNAAQLLNVHSSGRPEIEWARAVIERQTQHLVRLVDDLLDVSRMVRGQITLQKKPVELAEVVQAAVETSRPLIRRRKHHLTVQLPDTPVRLEADLTRLAQVISNLLNNAAKYTDDGGQIRLDAAVREGVVTIRVRDTGLGVDPDLLPHVFDLFTQADRTPDRSEGGLGIGLTLVKRLVELHGGAVEAHSEGLGSGAEFIVRLPVLPAGATSEPVMPSRVPVVAAADARSLRILVVDDNVDAADSIAMLLNMEGHQTRSVNTARAALLAVPDFKPEVVLLDIGLPEMDGYEVARRLREQNGAGAATRRMRLVAVTGYGQPADRRRAQAAGFDEHMVKPVEPTALQDFLRVVQSDVV